MTLLAVRGYEAGHVDLADLNGAADSPLRDSTFEKQLLELLRLAGADGNGLNHGRPVDRRRAPSRQDVLAIAGGGRSVSGLRSTSGVIRTLEGITVYTPIRPGAPWRAVWYESDGSRRACRAVDEDAMEGKLEPVRRRLAGLPPISRASNAAGAELVAHYLSADRLPPDRQWSSSYRAAQERRCKKVLEVIGDLPCQRIEVWHMQQIVNSASTANVGRHMQDLISGLVKAGIAAGYVDDPRLAMVHWQAGGRPRPEPQARQAGQSLNFVDPVGLPSHRDVAALASATQRKRLAAWWRELMPYLAAYSGVRLGELLALTADDVALQARTLRVVRKVVEVEGVQLIELPKGGIVRTTIYPAISPTGFQLAEALQRRVTEALRERKAGSNPQALLFPARNGLYLRQSSFWVSVVDPAMREAAWRDEDGNGEWTWHTLRHVFCTTAINEWKMDLTDVTRLAGHANSHITTERYLGTVTGVLERAFERTQRNH